MGTRYIAQRILTGEFLDWEVPLVVDGPPRRDLSGPGQLTGTVTPEYGRLIGADGAPILAEWATAIYPEEDGVLRGGYLLRHSSFDGVGAWKLECAAFSSYFAGLPWTDSYSAIGVEALDVARMLWVQPQTHPRGNLRLGVYGATVSGQTLGTPEVTISFVDDDGTPVESTEAAQPYTLDWWDAKDIGAEIDTLAQSTPFDYVEHHAWVPPVNADGLVDVTGQPPELVQWMRDTGYVPNPADTRLMRAPSPHLYTADPTEVTQDTLDDLLGKGWQQSSAGGRVVLHPPVDYPVIAHWLTLGTPRIGTRRDDLRFAQGENIVTVVTPERDGEMWANEVLAFGAGEGSAVLKSQSVSPPENTVRLRRVAVYTDKGITNQGALDAEARRELSVRLQDVQISSIQLRDHPNARLGSWALGDDILVQAYVPWLGDVRLYHRIIGEEYDDGSAVLYLERPDGRA